MADAAQLKRLKRSVKVWNSWRVKHPDVPIDLKKADLRGADLRGADLGSADMSGANLAEANLRGAILRRANLRGTTLTGATLTGADLTDARLEDAYLYGANLTGVDLSPLQRREAIFDRIDDLGSANQEETSEAVRRVLEEMAEEAKEALPPPPPHSRGQEEAPPPTLEEVCFTSIYPKEAQVETWQTLLVYAHVLSAIDALRKDAQRFAEQIPSPKEVSAPASTPLKRGTELTIVPSCEQVTFNPERITLKWLEDYQRAEFRFRADGALAEDAARGQIHIYAGPLLVGTLTFAMLFGKTAPNVTAPHEEHSQMYRQEDIFVSYSHKDTALVLACKKAYEALGLNILIDEDDLRSGQVWNDELMNLIDRASIFQLFWSQNSSQSKYCRQEWEHALKKNQDGFIRPVYWETPLPPPPDELSKYHFEYMEFEAGGPATRGATSGTTRG
jgi:hypothetical protein